YFIESPTDAYYYENYRRYGEPTKRPLENNIFTPLFSAPVTGIPEQIVIDHNKYYQNVHYWLVQEVASYAGTIRARDGIEWSATIPGDLNSASLGLPV